MIATAAVSHRLEFVKRTALVSEGRRNDLIDLLHKAIVAR
jgi:hypothetical protein